ncbi:MAG TPA: haloacid dehalogenase type II [Polyangiales bacterium]
MQRRTMLGGLLALASSAAHAACARPTLRTTPTSRAEPDGLRAICFDLFTLFDPRSVVFVAEHEVGEKAAGLCELWRARQFQYAFLRAAARQYRDFRAITEDALISAAASLDLTLVHTQRERLVRAYSELSPWPDTREALTRFRDRGLLLAPLANYAPSMLEPLLSNAGLASMFDCLISTDLARSYKPAPEAYALGERLLGLPRRQIAFSAFGGWDAAGARWFGYPTFWVNRLGVASEELAPGPDETGASLRELEAFVVRRIAPTHAA